MRNTSPVAEEIPGGWQNILENIHYNPCDVCIFFPKHLLLTVVRNHMDTVKMVGWSDQSCFLLKYSCQLPEETRRHIVSLMVMQMEFPVPS